MSASTTKLLRKRGGKKKVKDFELTLSQSTLCKAHVFMALEEFCESLVVSQEAHTNEHGVQVGSHFHCYLRLYKRDRIVGLRGVARSNLFDDDEETQESIHISTLRNAKHWIKYITKEDTHPMVKNVDKGTFHQSYKIHEYIRNHEVYNTTDPFIRQNPSLVNIIGRMHTEYWSKVTMNNHRLAVIARPVMPDYEINWVQRVSETLTQHKNLYLYGDTGVGKTVCINWLLQTNIGTVYLPCGSTNWEFGEINNCTVYAVAGDAGESYLSSHRQAILRLTDGDPISINVKCGGFKTVIFKGILIVISNYPPEQDAALLRRFTVINANEYGVSETIQPKTEIQEDVEETINISSEEELENLSTDDERASNSN